MAVYRIEVKPRAAQASPAQTADIRTRLQEAGLPAVTSLEVRRLFYLEGDLTPDDANAIAIDLLTDPVVEDARVVGPESAALDDPTGVLCEVQPRPGVMDPVALSTLAELRSAGHPVDHVRTGVRYALQTVAPPDLVRQVVGRVLANDCIEEVVLGAAPLTPAPRPPEYAFELRHVALRELDDAALERLSRTGHLFLSLEEMQALQHYYRAQEREPTELELETLAQTWSEHCVHKTLKSAMRYRGAPLPTVGDRVAASGEVGLRYDNLLRDTIARATREIMAAGRGPECLSVFVDNAGVIGFDEAYGVAFKVETHNHPSAIEPYGGAATGIGGCIRDVMGCGLAARPIANTDVFCVAPGSWPQARLPKGVLHPARVLRGIVQGVADYGNRMGIPTVNGAVYFDPRYLGNPLVYCGCLGLLPRDKVAKAARPGDHVVVIGGRTGRDGIHGATFSSAELTDTHVDEFSHAVQIGNAITEKRCLDALLRARDHADGCLYSAVTDCGAGGLSSAVGEMGEEVGVEVELEHVPLKYAGLRYDEIWISEAQERMVLAVPPAKLATLLEIMAEEEVEATVIGTFGSRDRRTDEAQLLVRYSGQLVGQLAMAFLHDGLPQRERDATWQPSGATPPPAPRGPWDALLRERLADPNIASKQWIIRRYDHEVQGGSVIKPLTGPGNGPADAAVLRPRLGHSRGVALGCGLAPWLGDIDPYWMAAASIDEALRNVVAVGGNPRQTAILDNFCWGRSDDPQQLGALVRACQACYDVALAFGTPFISGKDSLNNAFALEDSDVEPLCDELAAQAAVAGWSAETLALIQAEIRRTRRLRIPATLLISAVSIVDDVQRCLTPDLKRPGEAVLLVGGLDPLGFDPAAAWRVHETVAALGRAGQVSACHDVSDGGWLVTVAEMAIAGDRGAALEAVDAAVRPFAPLVAGYVVTTPDEDQVAGTCAAGDVPVRRLGMVTDAGQLADSDGRSLSVAALRALWSGG